MDAPIVEMVLDVSRVSILASIAGMVATYPVKLFCKTDKGQKTAFLLAVSSLALGGVTIAAIEFVDGRSYLREKAAKREELNRQEEAKKQENTCQPNLIAQTKKMVNTSVSSFSKVQIVGTQNKYAPINFAFIGRQHT